IGEFRDGRRCVPTVANEPAPGVRLEAFDGNSFELFFEPKRAWDLGNELTFLRIMEDETLWLGSSLGLGSWDCKTKTFLQTRTVPQGRAVELIEAVRGKIWYATGAIIRE